MTRADKRESRRIQEEWTQADVDGDGKLNFSEIATLVHVLNIAIDNTALKKLFDEIDVDNSGNLRKKRRMLYMFL